MEEKTTVMNGRITSTMLGDKGGPAFVFDVRIKLCHGAVAFGGWVLDAPEKHNSGAFIERVGTKGGMDAIMRLMDVVGVSCWEDLEGKYVRCVMSGRGSYGSRILGLGNIIEDKWFIAEEVFKQGRGQEDGEKMS